MNRLHATQRRPIPERPALPYVGHALGIPRGEQLVDHLLQECEQLGPIFRLRVFGNEQLIVSGSELVAELSDSDVYSKCVHADLIRLRDIGGDGLFTAFNEEPNWQKAHNILMPSFTREAMRQYHSKMVSAARSLIGAWERNASRDNHVDVSRDMTRLTFDTIGMCGFGYDFESFTTDEVHPFVASMTRALIHAQEIGEMPPFLSRLRRRRNQQYSNDLATMQDLITEVIERRRREDSTRDDDLLGRMMNTIDPDSGELLDDANIRNQVVTFLIAGHETTGAAMSFALHYLSKHPAVLARAQREVDELWGIDDDIAPSFDDVGQLTYVRQVLDEALRLWPTAPGFAVSPNRDTVVGDGYEIREGDVVQVFIPALHRQPEWGANVHNFDPDRFSPEAIEARPGHVYKPFGHGERACIGRQFALHEATLVLAMLLHRFHLDDRSNYQLSLSMTLTIKPDAFFLTPRLRTSAERQPRPLTGPEALQQRTINPDDLSDFTELSLFHGSNLGTSASVARELAAAGVGRGFTTSVAPLNDAVAKLVNFSTHQAVIVVASSYNGRPTDDAQRFVDWVQNLEPGSLDGLSFAVLGVGDRSYADTYQRIPTVIDQALESAGATRITAKGAADVGGNFAAAVHSWTDDLWQAVGRGTASDSPASFAETEPQLILESVVPLAERRVRHHGLTPMTVLDASELVDTAHQLGRSKRFVRLRLPDGVTYRTGDHLAILPSNPRTLVERVISRFDLQASDLVRVRLNGWWNSALPTEQPLTISELLQDYVELQQPASREDVAFLADSCQCPPERGPLNDLVGLDDEDFERTITIRGVSMLDLLESYRSVELSLEQFLARLPSLEPRRYSISSSNAADPQTVDLMVSVVDAPHRAFDGPDGRSFLGVASHYLAGKAPGDTVAGRVVPCNDHFRLSADQAAILISAGTGLAPFRGMIADRRHSRTAAPLVAYFGCDHPDVDFLHREELEAADTDGLASLRATFAFAPISGHRFVQDRMLSEAAEIWSLIEDGAHIRVCGDAARLGAGVDKALLEIFSRCAAEGGTSDQDAQNWLAELRKEHRYVSDVW